MRRSLAKFRESEASNHTPSLADFTTTTPELKFSVHTGSYVGGDLDGGRGASTRRRACAHAREPGRVQWTSRRAYGIHQRAVGELMGLIFSARVILKCFAWQKQHNPQPIRRLSGDLWSLALCASNS